MLKWIEKFYVFMLNGMIVHKCIGEEREFIIQYYLVNDTMEVREVHKANDGRDPFPILITRHKIPKDRYDIKG